MKNSYNIKNKHKDKGNYYAGKFQNSGFIPVKREKTRFSIGDNVRNSEHFWNDGKGIIKNIFYNKYNELRCIVEEYGGAEYECFTWEIYMLPLTRKVLFEKYKKIVPSYITFPYTYSGVISYNWTYYIEGESFLPMSSDVVY
jgi:hypothetical protein